MMGYDSETDTELEGKSKKKKGDLSKPQEFGGWFGALILTLLIPVGTILLELACTNSICSSKHLRIPQLKDLKQWRTFLNPQATVWYVIITAFISIASLLPIGRHADGQQCRTGRLKYRMNGKV